jgi:hypothetical protein
MRKPTFRSAARERSTGDQDDVSVEMVVCLALMLAILTLAYRIATVW